LCSPVIQRFVEELNRKVLKLCKKFGYRLQKKNRHPFKVRKCPPSWVLSVIFQFF
jgi:RimJ/RimL family protein N-acetyltransferase